MFGGAAGWLCGMGGLTTTGPGPVVGAPCVGGWSGDGLVVGEALDVVVVVGPVGGGVDWT